MGKGSRSISALQSPTESQRLRQRRCCGSGREEEVMDSHENERARCHQPSCAAVLLFHNADKSLSRWAGATLLMLPFHPLWTLEAHYQ